MKRHRAHYGVTAMSNTESFTESHEVSRYQICRQGSKDYVYDNLRSHK